MRYVAIFSLLALGPAAVSAEVPATPRLISMALCGGGIIVIPTGPMQHDGDGHCAKACHASCSRKRILRHI